MWGSESVSIAWGFSMMGRLQVAAAAEVTADGVRSQHRGGLHAKAYILSDYASVKMSLAKRACES